MKIYGIWTVKLLHLSFPTLATLLKSGFTKLWLGMVIMAWQNGMRRAMARQDSNLGKWLSCDPGAEGP